MITLSALDLVLLIILFFFAFGGFFAGFIRTIGRLVGIFLGFVLAINYTRFVADWLGNPFGLGDRLVKIIVFVLLFIIVERLVSFIFYLLKKVFNLPFLKSIDRILGLLFGTAFGILITGVLLTLFLTSSFKFFGLQDRIKTDLENSNVGQFIYDIGEKMTPKIPDYFNDLKEYTEDQINEYAGDEIKAAAIKYATDNNIELDPAQLENIDLAELGISFDDVKNFQENGIASFNIEQILEKLNYK